MYEAKIPWRLTDPQGGQPKMIPGEKICTKRWGAQRAAESGN